MAARENRSCAPRTWQRPRSALAQLQCSAALPCRTLRAGHGVSHDTVRDVRSARGAQAACAMSAAAACATEAGYCKARARAAACTRHRGVNARKQHSDNTQRKVSCLKLDRQLILQQLSGRLTLCQDTAHSYAQTSVNWPGLEQLQHEVYQCFESTKLGESKAEALVLEAITCLPPSRPACASVLQCASPCCTSACASTEHSCK